MTAETLTTLERCRDWHARCANHARAKAELVAHQGETGNARRYFNRAEGHLTFRDALDTALRLLKAKGKRAAFTPPTWEEVRKFALNDETCRGWPLVDIQAWYDHFQSNGWKVSGKATMRDWKAAARNGARRWKKEHGSPASKQKADPEGWREFLQAKNQFYVEYQFAADWAKVDFRKGAKK